MLCIELRQNSFDSVSSSQGLLKTAPRVPFNDANIVQNGLHQKTCRVRRLNPYRASKRGFQLLSFSGAGASLRRFRYCNLEANAKTI